MEKESDPCIDDTDYSYTVCISKYVHKKVGCRILAVDQRYSIHNISAVDESQKCKSMDQIHQLKSTLIWIRHASLKNLTLVTGCLQKCSQNLV